MERYFNLILTKENSQQTLKSFLESCHLASSKIYQLINNHNCYLNGIIMDGKEIMKENDTLIINISDYEKIDYLPEEGSLEVLYEDDYLLIINKPKGKIIFPDNKDGEGTIANMIANYYYTHGQYSSIRHLHRLDKETSGCLMYAKDLITHAKMNYDWENQLVKKEYLAYVEGDLDHDEVITTSIGRDRHQSNKMIVSPTGQTAFTDCKVIIHNSKLSKVKIMLKTGRTHQIRVHMASINHPLLGDYLYGSKIKGIPTIMLHAKKITFVHPYRNETITIDAPIPKIMRKLDELF